MVLDDMEQHFDLHIIVCNIPICLFLYSKKIWLQYVTKMDIQTCNFHFILFKYIDFDIHEVVNYHSVG
jgi:hypothetical protein